MTQDEVFASIASVLDETSGPLTPFETGNRIIDRALQFIRDHGCEHKQTVIDSVGPLYDRYVRPIDIPGIPNIIVEKKVDDMLKGLLCDWVERLANRLCDGDNGGDTTDGPSIVAE